MSEVLERAVRIVDRIVHVGIWISGSFLLLASAIIGVDVIARKAFGISLGGSDEIGGYVLAISSAWAFSFTLLKRGHIRVDALYNQASVRLQMACDVLAVVALGFFMGFVTFYGYEVLVTSIELNARANTPLGTPLWIPQFMWFSGLCVFMLTTAVLLVRAFAAAVEHDASKFKDLVGIQDADQEVEKEVRAAEIQLASLRTERRQE